MGSMVYSSLWVMQDYIINRSLGLSDLGFRAKVHSLLQGSKAASPSRLWWIATDFTKGLIAISREPNTPKLRNIYLKSQH